MCKLDYDTKKYKRRTPLKLQDDVTALPGALCFAQPPPPYQSGRRPHPPDTTTGAPCRHRSAMFGSVGRQWSAGLGVDKHRGRMCRPGCRPMAAGTGSLRKQHLGTTHPAASVYCHVMICPAMFFPAWVGRKGNLIMARHWIASRCCLPSSLTEFEFR